MAMNHDNGGGDIHGHGTGYGHDCDPGVDDSDHND